MQLKNPNILMMDNKSFKHDKNNLNGRFYLAYIIQLLTIEALDMM